MTQYICIVDDQQYVQILYISSQELHDGAELQRRGLDEELGSEGGMVVFTLKEVWNL